MRRTGKGPPLLSDNGVSRGVARRVRDGYWLMRSSDVAQLRRGPGVFPRSVRSLRAFLILKLALPAEYAPTPRTFEGSCVLRRGRRGSGSALCFPFATDGSSLFWGGGFIIPLIAIVLIALGIYIAVDDDEEGPPVSP